MKRDQYGIIIQTNEDPAYEDGGDSAFSTGLMAFADSREDQLLLPKFIIQNKLVRHPYQQGWNESKNTSRDQVIAFFAGLAALDPQNFDPRAYDILVAACISYAKSWRVNYDILLPDVKLYLYLCARVKPPKLLSVVGKGFAVLSIIWDCFIKPHHEMNQSVCKNIVLGEPWIQALHRWHPELENNVAKYFCGFPFRNKSEIGSALTAKIDKVLAQAPEKA